MDTACDERGENGSEDRSPASERRQVSGIARYVKSESKCVHLCEDGLDLNQNSRKPDMRRHKGCPSSHQESN